MTGAALGLVFRDASGRIVVALASRFRDLDLAEESFADACARALQAWSRDAAALAGTAKGDAGGVDCAQP